MLDYSANNFAAWDRFGQVLNQSWQQTGGSQAVLDGYTYTYDASGNRTSQDNVLNSSLDETFGYDSLNRLISASCANGNTETWTLDSLGTGWIRRSTASAKPAAPTRRTKSARLRRAAPRARKVTICGQHDVEHAEADRQRRQRTMLPMAPAAQAEDRSVRSLGCQRCFRCLRVARGKTLPERFCDRPGCYEPPRDSPRVAASYCSDGCRAAMEQCATVNASGCRRKRKAGRLKRRLEYKTMKARRHRGHAGLDDLAAQRSSAQPDLARCAVPVYRLADVSRLSCEGSEEVRHHDSQTSSPSRPRAPPTEERL